MKTLSLKNLNILRVITIASLASFAVAQAEVPYAAMLEKLRSEISTKLPTVAEATRKSIVEAKDRKARVLAVREAADLKKFLSNSELDKKLARFSVLNEATPAGLTAFAGQGTAQKKMLDALLADDALLLQIAVADGARPLHSKGKPASPPNYGKAMEIFTAIQQASPKAKQGVLQRLALAVALEFSEQSDADEEEAAASSRKIDPVKRYQHFEKAFEAGELDPNFIHLGVWDLRFVVCAPEPDEALTWGREMLRNYRPDHIYTENDGWRYADVVNTDVRYGSIDVRNDRPELLGVQNILMNGGICGRRAFFARYICRAFGIPATARPSGGHGASARWTPQGWAIVLGPPWGHGWTTTTRYRNDHDFVATTQARARGEEFLKVKRAQWIGEVKAELPTYGDHDNKTAPAFWHAVALATQGRINEDSKAVTLDALGAELGEADGKTVAKKIAATAISPEDRKITLGNDGSITIPAVAYTKKESKEDKEEGGANDVIAMKSFGDGQQVFLPRFFQQKPILVRGGTWQHEASLCESSTRHWRGRRPKTSGHMRGLRLAVTPSEGPIQKELRLELSDNLAIEFVYIPPGKFTMGGELEQKAGDILANTPKHEVTLTQGFYLGKYELTQAQYGFIMNKEFGKSSKGPDHPMDGIKPSYALLLCDDLSAKTGMEVRVPTEAEWEYAARAGTNTRWFFGDDASKLGDYAWFKDNAEGKSHPVGQKKPNPWGLYDMYGNIAEMVRDDHLEDYYAQGPKVDPVGPLMGIHSSMQFTIDVPKAGDYKLSAKVVTSNVKQSLQLAVNDASSPTSIELPFTIGMWGESEPVTVTLKQGTNTLNFWRDQAPQYGVALKSFTLKPVGER